ncbi:hypothetical protein PsAD2_04005 [Pseudovibrio axinellae]|uniref:Uncharacterized protein n=1 Tax=Pseudovibrio axinellae TaxID=989403 RepID=A0A165U320_9HYPH|nr:plasmid replication protein RepC [Pseudovibrio axinellae]KZL10346.1 hypothetical protein PsAD2_04005 [Pseudovibrio axinellae]SER81469.1 replication initiation protein RepC [Pseudovibrio axinellae]
MHAQQIAPFRRVNPDILASQDLARKGLEDDVEKSLLAMALKRAAPVLKITGTPYQILDILLGLVRKEDLKAGGKPLVAISNEKLAEYADRSVRTVSRCIKRLVEAGVLSYSDSPNGRRFIVRDRSGAVDYGYGLDLTPACRRIDELRKKANEFQAKLKQDKQARRFVIARARAVKDTASLLGELGHEILTRLEEVLALPLDPITRAAAVDEIYQEALDKQTNLACLGDKNGVAISNTTPSHIRSSVEDRWHGSSEPSLKSCSDNEAYSSVEEAFENKHAASTADPQKKMCDQQRVFQPQGPLPTSMLAGVSIGLLEQAAVQVREVLQSPIATWPSLFAITEDLRHLIGLSEAGWKAACAAQGQHLAAACLLVVAEKAMRYPEAISRPGGYFRAMIDRANGGKLNLQKSVFGLINMV